MAPAVPEAQYNPDLKMVTALTQSLHLFRVTLDLIRKGKRCQTQGRKSGTQDPSDKITHFLIHTGGEKLTENC